MYQHCTGVHDAGHRGLLCVSQYMTEEPPASVSEARTGVQNLHVQTLHRCTASGFPLHPLLHNSVQLIAPWKSLICNHSIEMALSSRNPSVRIPSAGDTSSRDDQAQGRFGNRLLPSFSEGAGLQIEVLKPGIATQTRGIPQPNR